MITRKQILNLSPRIVEDFNPEKILLFGSHVCGHARNDSDVDLLVIMPFEGKSIHQAVEIRNRVAPTFPVDIIVHTPESLSARVSQNDWLLRGALEHGEVLHETAHA